MRSIHNAFYKWKTMEDNQKKFIPQLAIESLMANWQEWMEDGRIF